MTKRTCAKPHNFHISPYSWDYLNPEPWAQQSDLTWANELTLSGDSWQLHAAAPDADRKQILSKHSEEERQVGKKKWKGMMSIRIHFIIKSNHRVPERDPKLQYYQIWKNSAWQQPQLLVPYTSAQKSPFSFLHSPSRFLMPSIGPFGIKENNYMRARFQNENI